MRRSPTPSVGRFFFDETSSAGNATIINTSDLQFAHSSTAGSARITTNDAAAVFTGNSTADQAELITNAGGQFDFSGTTGPNNDSQISAGSIAGAGQYLLGANHLTVGGNNLSTEVSGTISGTGASLEKVGTGTLNLSGANTYTGGTTVTAGTLGGNGTIGAVTVLSGATLAPGASAGTFHTGSVTFNTGATFAVELGGTSVGQFDQLAVTGTVALGGATLSASFINSFHASGTFTIINNDGTGDAVTGQFAQGTGFSVGGVTYAINYAGGDGNDVVLTVTLPLSTTPTPGNDSLTGTDGPDTIAALESDDIVRGLGAGDLLFGKYRSTCPMRIAA